jgi:antitoxin component of MazEF toxin-antitoxin module
MKNVKHKLTRVGKRSLAVVIPAVYIKALKWRERQVLLVKKNAGAIVIRDAKTKKRKK